MNIAIKLPNSLKERTLAFPLLHTLVEKLKEKLAEDEILKVHLLSLGEGIDVLNLLPFDAFYHELEEDDVKSVFSIHRACANLKIDQNIDFFISTTESFVDVSIGKNIGAKESIGFAVGKNGWLLNKKVTIMANDHKSNQMYRLIKGVINEIPPMETVQCRELAPTYSDWKENPYVVINLDLLDGEVNPEWKEFVDLFVGKRFIFMCSEIPEDQQQEFLEEYIATLPRKNTYKLFVYESNIDFGKLISYALTFITHDSPLVNIASYCKCHVFLLNIKENLNITGPKYFPGEVWSFNLSDPVYGQGDRHNYTKIFDELVVFIEDRVDAPKSADGEEVASDDESSTND